jgi:hypothetical protein
MSLFAGSDYSAPGAFPAHTEHPSTAASRLRDPFDQNSSRAPNW